MRMRVLAMTLSGFALVLLAGADVVAAETACPADPELWAIAMTETLPAFANREFARTPYGNSMMRVSPPEVVSFSDGEVKQVGGSVAQDDLIQVYFSTTERWFDNSSEVRTLPRAYRVTLVRPTTAELVERSWLLVSVAAAQSPRSTGGLAPDDISYGAIANAIRQWQHQGCPHPAAR